MHVTGIEVNICPGLPLAAGIGAGYQYMINQLIELERQPIVQKEQRIQVLEQVKDAWRDINMRLRHLRSTVQELSKKENILSNKPFRPTLRMFRQRLILAVKMPPMS